MTKSQKILCFVLRLFGFLIQYIMPLILFGMVTPLVHGDIKGGLTKCGIFVALLGVIFAIKKLKELILQHPKSLGRGIILSIFPIAIWLILWLALGKIDILLDSLIMYWSRVIIFIVIGRIFYIIEETISNKESEGKQ